MSVISCARDSHRCESVATIG